MPTVTDSISGLFTSITDLFTAILNTFLAALNSIFAIISTAVGDVASLAKGILNFVMSNLLIVGLVTTAVVGGMVYQARQSGTAKGKKRA